MNASIGWRVLLLVLAGASDLTRASALEPVEAARHPGGLWRSYPTRTLADLPEAIRCRTDGERSVFGGLRALPLGTGAFFRVTNVNGRAWLVDPAGCAFLHLGVASVTPLWTDGARAALKATFGNNAAWAEGTTAMLRTNGFNGVGAWSETETLSAVRPPLVYTRIWNFMSGYGRERGGTYPKPGHTGYPNDCIFVFDPGFEAYCEKLAVKLEAARDDPWLLGHFSDNEMPLPADALRKFLALPVHEAGYRVAAAWLRSRQGGGPDLARITPEDERAFLSIVVDRYHRLVSQAIRRHDPNHLFLGSRLHGGDLARPEIFRAAGPYLDVVSVNYYGAWTPVAERLRLWAAESGRPILITEWYAKGMDSGLPNTSGAGWVVHTQADRGRFYQNFALGLLESGCCVGWHWFKYADNDPDDHRADPSNVDANKGIVSSRYEPYAPLLDAMREFNLRAYSLARYFGRARPRRGSRGQGSGVRRAANAPRGGAALRRRVPRTFLCAGDRFFSWNGEPMR